ncbi:unnamed protein product (macronuclear) [Paramecium tetraurelia]|uniref:Protein kinase domain-containing protein n=1 Tax=Paramecium tetraurelia TaxID=5888 RepID=A0BD48_PARTE|nr:uncharacterized protein GSPATT00004559001 [Paramecium tetraurelia]CAK56465.1 unnamed protein product [Paramecium tetraurelia]|eukprot:XP_001423863.1 hypothetical protein (macronuclear) [Paramecium tetraurelia strain d4-2]
MYTMETQTLLGCKELLNPQSNLGSEVSLNIQKSNLYVIIRIYRSENFTNLLLKLFKEDYQRFNLEEQLNLNLQYQMQSQLVVTIQILFHALLYGVSLDITYKPQKVCFTSYLTKPDTTPIYASDKNIINLLSFYTLKQNDKLVHGSLSIDPLTGLFQYKTLTTISFYEQIELSEGFLDCLRFNIVEHQKLMEIQAPFVLYQMNKITFKEFKKFTREDQYESKQKNIDQLKEIFKRQMHQEMTKEEKDKFLDYPKPKSLPLLTKISVQKTGDDLLQQWKDQLLITSGGYSEIRKVQLAYKISDNDQAFTRALAVKTDKSSTNNKVNHELSILKTLSKTTEKGNGEAYIVTSYYDENLKGCYFMEFYNNGSLEQYTNSKSQVLSLRTKLFILAGIINGIDFLHYKQIAHLDLKMGNILIQKQLIPKICDFGEAKPFDFLEQDKSNFSRSLPYAAPELYNSNEITPAFDIFSFGILMCKFVFEQFPIEYNPNDLTNLAERYKNNTYAIKRNLIQQIKCGPKKIMKKILHLIILCLQSNPKSRPKPKWILAILWKMINFLDSF